MEFICQTILKASNNTILSSWLNMQTDSESYFMEKFDSLHNSQKEAILLCTEANSTWYSGYC